MEGTKCVLVVGSGKSPVNIKELVSRISHEMSEIIVEAVDNKTVAVLHALNDIDRSIDELFRQAIANVQEAIVKILLSVDKEFGETSVPTKLPRFTYARITPVHARDPPREACTEHPKKSGIIERS